MDHFEEKKTMQIFHIRAAIIAATIAALAACGQCGYGGRYDCRTNVKDLHGFFFLEVIHAPCFYVAIICCDDPWKKCYQMFRSCETCCEM